MERRIAPLVIAILLTGMLPVAAVEVAQMEAGTLYRLGVEAFHRRDYNGAATFLEQRARLEPQDANVFYYLGNCYLNTGRNDHAARMFAHCIRMDAQGQAGQYALKALEALSAAPARAEAPAPPKADPKAVEAAADSLITAAPVDKTYSEALKRIRSDRQSFKTKITSIFQRLMEDMQSLNPRTTPNYAFELEKLRGEAENKVEELQAQRLRQENRLMAPDKIDVRAVPEKPQPKRDNARLALGPLIDNLMEEEPFDPFGPDVPTEISAKFMSIKDVFGELSTYEPAARNLAKQLFLQLKASIESKQNLLDQQTYQIRNNLVRDVYNLKCSLSESPQRTRTPSLELASTKIPRREPNSLSPVDMEISKATERALNRIKDLHNQYDRDVSSLIAGTKEKLHSMVAQAGGMNAQLRHTGAATQLVPLGTSLYTRNYVHFPDLDNKDAAAAAKGQAQKQEASGVVELHAEARKIELPPAGAAGKPAGK